MTFPNEIAPLDFEAIGHSMLFTDLSRADVEDICRVGRTRKVARGSFFFLQGDPVENMYILLAGRVKLAQVDADGQQILFRVGGPYTLFGAVAFGQTGIYPVSAEAMEECSALGWTKSNLMDFISRYPRLAVNAIRVMSASTQEFQERFRQLANERVERRLAHTLLRLASQTGKKTEEGVLIDMPLTRQDLAEMTGTTLYTVSRLLSQWESQGMVTANREHIIIRYPHGLVMIAED